MAATVWSGYLTFGLVSFPVELKVAARRKTIDFDLLHRKDHSRIRQVTFCQEEDKPLKRDELVKGYEFEKGKYVIFEPDEISSQAPPTAKAMEISEFVNANEVNPVHFDASYYLAPAEGGEKPYSLLYRAMKETSYSAVAKVAMHSREHTVILRCGPKGIVLHTMYYAEELRAGQEYAADTKAVSDKELALAKSLIENLTETFDASKYHDSYRERIEQLIEAKIEGKKLVATPSPKTGTVVNIMDALEKSLENAKAGKASGVERKPAKTAAVAKKATAKKRAS